MNTARRRRGSSFTRTLGAACAVLLGSLPSAAQSPSSAAGTVTLPLAEYDRLVERAAHPPALPPVAPLPSAVARADLSMKVGTDAARGTLTVQGEVWRDGTVKVPILRGGTVIDAVQDGVPVALLADAGSIAALVRGPSTFSISMTWGTELASEPGRAVVRLPAVHAGSVHATLDLPGENADARVEPGIVRSRTASGGRTVIGLTLEPGVASRVSWSSREGPAAGPREARLAADVKSLVTIAENEVRLGALFDVSVTQGEPESFAVLLPQGFTVAAVTGASVEADGVRDGRLRLVVRERARRRHQFLLALERTTGASSAHGELLTPAIEGVQRETGEIALEAVGTVELSAAESGPLRRLDPSEVSDALRSLARSPLLAAFRYQRREGERVPVAFDVKRFADAAVVAAAAERAEVTTLVTTEGRTLTEVSLDVRNRGQLFLKVGLPPGASILSAEVGAEPVKPVEGSDGARVPLVRPSYQPAGVYRVSFVYVAPGSPFAKKGQASLALPRMDLPISVVEWELFLPDRFEVKRFEGDAMVQDRLTRLSFADETDSLMGAAPPPPPPPLAAMRTDFQMRPLGPNQVGGFCVDAEGATLPGVTIVVSQGRWSKVATTGADGAFVVSDVPPGSVTITARLEGFKPVQRQARGGGPPVRFSLEVSDLAETVQVSAEPAEEQKSKQMVAPQVASQNVLNLQRRLSGVLPVRIDVPRAGHSYMLVRPLVLDEPTTVRFEYKSR